MNDHLIIDCPHLQVRGKAVLITGCDTGFGHALAKHLHKLGFTVFAGCLLKVREQGAMSSFWRRVLVPVNVGRANFWLTGPLYLQDGGGEGAKELEELHSERMKVVQLDVCSDEQVDRAVQVIQDSLADLERGKQLGGRVH